MAPLNPLADWERVGDHFYRKSRVYDAVFGEDVELENYIVAGAPYGGAIGNNFRCIFVNTFHFGLTVKCGSPIS
jgi:hypothetical protein